MYTNVIYMTLHVIYANCLVEAVFWTNLSFVTKVYKTNCTLVEYYDSFLEFANSTSFRYILLLTLLLLFYFSQVDFNAVKQMKRIKSIQRTHIRCLT